MGERNNGYGMLYRHISAHRLSYELLVGPVPEGLVLDHLCRNRACCRPDHLEPVSRGENVLRGDTIAARKAAQTECTHGHEYTPSNTGRQSNGTRYCRKCAVIKQRGIRHHKKARSVQPA
jgi:hypothetical protein